MIDDGTITFGMKISDSEVRDRCVGGVYLAASDDGDAIREIWPRVVYPSLDDALTSSHALSGMDDPDMELGVCRGRIVWAWPVGWPLHDFWRWSTTPLMLVLPIPLVECWELTW